MPQSPRLLRPRASGFNPRSISGLALWLDASDASSLYTTDAGAVTAVSSPLEISGCVGWWDASDATSITKDGSNLVSQWNDKSGNARHATASGALRPTSGGLQNGRTVMQFTGTQAMSITGNFLQSDNVTMFAVAMKNTDHYGGIISSAPANPEDSPLLGFYSTTLAFVNRRQVVQQAVSNGVYRIIAAQSVGTTQQGWFDGVKTTDSVASVATNTSNTITKIGAFRTSSTADLNGNIAEIVCYGGNLSTTDRARVEAYLAAKWGISGVHAPATATNDPVGAWLDKSGNGRNATQATGALRPTLGTLGAKNALAFAGNAIATQSYAAKATSTYVYVGRHDETADTFFQTGPTNGFHSHLVEQTSKFRRNEAGTKGVILASNVGVGAVSLWCVDFSNDAISVRHNGVTYGTTSVASEAAISDSSRATTLGRLAAAETYAQLNGRIAEFMVYGGRNLTSDERSRLERHLASKYAITLAPAASNADAQDWINRVYQNGGTVSASTASAVNQFCSDIDSAGIRDRFYRMGIFAGTGLNAALVPLYRGPSLGGTQYGNTTDTNVGPFVTANYNETGASGGLAGNGSNKYLNTGFPTNTLSASNRHLAAYPITWPNGAFQYFLGSESAAGPGQQQFALGHFDNADKGSFAFGPSSGSYLNNTTSISSGGMWIGVNTSGSGTIFRNGVSNGTTSLTAATPTAAEIYAFAVNRNGGGTNYFNGRIGGYSIGLSMTAAQAAAYNTAMQAFQTAMGRNV